MAPRNKPSTFPGLCGFPGIVQDDMGMLRALYIGSLVADRDRYRAGRPGMNVGDAHMIEDLSERAEYVELCKTLQKSTSYPRTQNHNTRSFFHQFGYDFSQRNFDPSFFTVDDLAEIQDKLSSRYRIVLIRYHYASGLCSLEWKGDVILPRVIYIVTDSDGKKWDTLSSTKGVFGKYLCSACLKTSDTSTTHRITCNSCNFRFKTQKCYDAHLHVRTAISGLSRCDVLKYCVACSSAYRPSNGAHVCGSSVWCNLCRDYTNNEHQCKWPEFTEKQRANLQKKQKLFRLAFLDVETTQAFDFDEGDTPEYYDEHLCTTIALCKICEGGCGVRKVIFQYNAVREIAIREPPYKVLDDFIDFLLTDKTMKGRTCYSHNGSRFDGHLILNGFLRRGIRPKIINKGSAIIRAEVKTRKTMLIFKVSFTRFALSISTSNLSDTYTLIPIPLSEFPKAFELECDSKGTYPHLLNTREHWGKVYDTVPEKRYFNESFMKEEQRKSFNEWYSTMHGVPYDVDQQLRDYCILDVEICMLGTMKFRETMIKQTSWCPLTCDGYGSVRQSPLALRYIRFMERENPRRKYQHALSPMGEKKVKVGGHEFSLDCYEEAEDHAVEIHGCCGLCYMDGTELIGGERAEEVRARSEARIDLLRTKIRKVTVIWEHTIRELLKDKSNGMADFFNSTEVPERLCLRQGLYGGRVEVIRSYLKATPEKMLCYADVTSMYPAVQALRDYPIGFPSIITSDFKPIEGNVFPYRGIAKVKVLPPRNLRLAVLPYRYQNSLYFPLCKSCVHDRSEVCNHEEEEQRAWTSVYATIELELAMRKGYVVLAVFEIFHWDQWSDQVYREFFRTFMRCKFAASGFPPGVVTQQHKEEYCAKINRKLDLQLRPEDISYSAPLRLISKLCNNSCWGKLAESMCHRKTEYLSTKQYLALRMDASRVINVIDYVDNDIIRITHSPKVETMRANKYSSLPHAIHVTAHARILLYDIVEKTAEGASYMDTDSIIYERDRNGVDPLASLMTSELGELTSEVDDGWELRECVLAGCKNYSLLLENLTTGELKTKLATKGITKDVSTLSKLTHSVIYDMVVNNNPEFIPIKRPELKRKMGLIRTVEQTKRYRPTRIKRATRESGEIEIHVPFGFKD